MMLSILTFILILILINMHLMQLLNN